jgi:integrase/recombinase XerD
MRLIAPKVKIGYMQDVRYKTKDGTYSIKMRVNYRSERFYINTRIRLTREAFQSILNGTARGDLLDIKFRLDQEMVRAQSTAESMQSFNITEFKRLYGVMEKTRTLTWYFEVVIGELHSRRQFGTAKHYKTALNILSAHWGKRFSFMHINAQMLEEFEEYYEQQGRSMGTVGNYMRALRAVYNRALDDHVISKLDYPFGRKKYIIPRVRKRKVGVPIEVVKEIHRYELEDPFHQFHRDLWIFSFHCNGMNMKDITNLRHNNLRGNTLEFIRQKTKRTRKNQQLPISVNLNKHAKAIIEKWATERKTGNEYIFPVLKVEMDPEEKFRRNKQATQNTRKLIKRIAEEKGWEFPINFMSARHSFGNRLNKNKEPLHVIQQAMGHSDPKITLHYLEDLEEEQQIYISSLTDYEL